MARVSKEQVREVLGAGCWVLGAGCWVLCCGATCVTSTAAACEFIALHDMILCFCSSLYVWCVMRVRCIRWRRRIWHQDKLIKAEFRKQEEHHRQQAAALRLLAGDQDDPSKRYLRPLHMQHDDHASELASRYAVAHAAELARDMCRVQPVPC